MVPAEGILGGGPQGGKDSIGPRNKKSRTAGALSMRKSHR